LIVIGQFLTLTASSILLLLIVDHALNIRIDYKGLFFILALSKLVK